MYAILPYMPGSNSFCDCNLFLVGNLFSYYLTFIITGLDGFYAEKKIGILWGAPVQALLKSENSTLSKVTPHDLLYRLFALKNELVL